MKMSGSPRGGSERGLVLNVIYPYFFQCLLLNWLFCCLLFPEKILLSVFRVLGKKP